MDVGAGAQGPQLTVAHIEQAGAGQTRAHAGDDGQVEPVITALTRQDIHRDGQAQRVEGGEHHLHLRLVGTLVFAVAKLEQAVRGDLPVAAGGGAVDAHGGRGQVIDPQDGLIERTLTGSPGAIITEGREDISQAVIRQVGRAQGCGQERSERALQLLGPGTHAIEPMVGSRQDVGQPDRGKPTQAQALAVAMRREVGVQDAGQLQTLHVGQQQRHVVDPFRVYCRWLAHVASLPHLPNLV